jgi:hypothetical protein
MLSLDALVRSVPAYQVAGRFAVDVVGILRPPRPGAGDDGPARYRLADAARPLEVEELFAQSAPSLTPSALGDRALVVRPHGEFLSTDQLALSQVTRDEGLWSIDLEITRSESQDGSPAPRDLYVVLRLDAGRHPLRRLELRFKGRWRDFQGGEKELAEPLSPVQVIEFSDAG